MSNQDKIIKSETKSNNKILDEGRMSSHQISEETPSEEQEKSASNPPDNKSSISLFQTVLSVLAAMIGIQNDQNRERDFKQGSSGTFIVVGIIMIIIFIFTLIQVVDSVLESSGVQ